MNTGIDKIQLDLTVEEALDYAKFIEQKKQDFMAQYPDIFNKIKEFDTQISNLLSAASKPNRNRTNGVLPGFDSDHAYPIKGTWNEKIKYFLSINKRLTSRKLKSYIMNAEGVTVDDKSEKNKSQIKRIGIGVAASLSVGVSNGIYKRELNSAGDNEFMIIEK